MTAVDYLKGLLPTLLVAIVSARSTKESALQSPNPFFQSHEIISSQNPFSASSYNHQSPLKTTKTNCLSNILVSPFDEFNTTGSLINPTSGAWGSLITTQPPSKPSRSPIIQISDRDDWRRGLFHNLPLSCVTPGSNLLISFLARFDGTKDTHRESSSSCDLNDDLSTDCPLVLIRTSSVMEGFSYKVVRHGDGMKDMDVGEWNDNEWNRFTARVEVTYDMVRAGLESFRVIMGGGADGSVLLLDDVSITRESAEDDTQDVSLESSGEGIDDESNENLQWNYVDLAMTAPAPQNHGICFGGTVQEASAEHDSLGKYQTVVDLSPQDRQLSHQESAFTGWETTPCAGGVFLTEPQPSTDAQGGNSDFLTTSVAYKKKDKRNREICIILSSVSPQETFDDLDHMGFDDVTSISNLTHIISPTTNPIRILCHTLTEIHQRKPRGRRLEDSSFSVPRANNGDADKMRQRGWRGYKASSTVESPGYAGSRYAHKAFKRYTWNSGIYQKKVWRKDGQVSKNITQTIRFKAKLVDEPTGKFEQLYDRLNGGEVKCDPTDKEYTMCPLVWVTVDAAMGKALKQQNILVRDYAMQRSSTGWYNFKSDFNLVNSLENQQSNDPITLKSIRFTFVGGPPGSMLIVDNINWVANDEATPLATTGGFTTTSPDSSAIIPTFDLSASMFKVTIAADSDFKMVHGICVGRDSLNPFVYSSDKSLSYAPHDLSRDSDDAAIRASDDGEMEIEGFNTTLCKDGTFLRPSISEREVAKRTQLHMRFAYTKEKNIDVCFFVEVGAFNGNFPYNLMRWKRFTNYETHYPLTWTSKKPNHTCKGRMRFRMVCLTTATILRERLIERRTTSSSWKLMQSSNMVAYGSAEYMLSMSSSFEFGYRWGGYCCRHHNNTCAHVSPYMWGSGQYAFQVKMRLNWAVGMYQNLEIFSVTESTTWRVSFRARLFWEGSGKPAACDPTDSEYLDCPLVWSQIKTLGNNPQTYNRLVRDTTMKWNAEGWSQFESFMTVLTDDEVDVEQFKLTFAGGAAGTVLILDQILFKKVSLMVDESIQNIHIGNTVTSFHQSYPFVNMLVPVVAETEMVHGFCTGPGYLEASVTTNFGALGYTVIDNGNRTLSEKEEAQKAVDSGRYFINGFEGTPCEGGIYLRPSTVSDIPTGTVAALDLIYTNSSKTDLCAFVEAGHKAANPLFSTLRDMGFGPSNDFESLIWYPPDEDWDFKYSFQVLCLGKQETKATLGNRDADQGISEWETVQSIVSVVEEGYGGGRAFKITDRDYFYSGIAQTTGLVSATAGNAWRVSFKAKLLNQQTNAPLPPCDPTDENNPFNCPFMILTVVKNTGERFNTNHFDDDITIEDNGWYSFVTVIRITEEMSERFLRARAQFAGGPAGSVLMLDDFDWIETTPEPTDMPTGGPSLTPSVTSSPTINSCGELLGANAEPNGKQFKWFGFANLIGTSSPGYNSPTAFRAYNRKYYRSGLGVNLPRISCLTPGSHWRVSFKAQLRDQKTNKPVACDPTPSTYQTCPLVYLEVYQDGERRPKVTILRDHEMVWNATEGAWNHFEAIFTVTPDMTSGLNKMSPFFAGGATGYVLLLDDISWSETTASPTMTPTRTITQSPTSSSAPTEDVCTNLLPISNAEGGSMQGWNPFTSRTMLWSPGSGGSQHAYRIFGRQKIRSGMVHNIRHRMCLAEDTTWRVSFSARMVDSNGYGIYCDPSQEEYTDCPYILIEKQTSSGTVVKLPFRDNTMEWIPNEWSTFNTIITVSPELAFDSSTASYRIIINGGNPGVIVMVDDIIFDRATAIPSSVPTTAFPTVTPSTSPPTVSSNPTIDSCFSLIGNGDAESKRLWGWSALWSKLDIIRPGFESSYAFRSYDRIRYRAGMVAKLRPKCLEDNPLWRISFMVRMYNPDTKNFVYCDSTAQDYRGCPLMYLKMYDYNGGERLMELRDYDMIWDPQGWSHYEYYLQMNENLSRYKAIHAVIGGGAEGAELYIDNISFTKSTPFPSSVPSASPTANPTISSNPTHYSCGNMILPNVGTLERGTTSPWKGLWSSVGLQQGGAGGSNYALKGYSRKRQKSGPYIYLRPLSCFNTETFFHVGMKVRLLDKNGKDHNCDPTKENYWDCPLVLLRMTYKDGSVVDHEIRDNSMSWNPPGWNTFSGYITLPAQQNLGNVRFVIAGGPDNEILVADDITFREVTEFPSMVPSLNPSSHPTLTPTLAPTGLPSASPTDVPTVAPTSNPTDDPCKEMIHNNGVEDGDLSHWTAIGSNTAIDTYVHGYRGSNYGIKVTNRDTPLEGIRTSIGPLRCLTVASFWKLSFHAKLFDETTGESLDCDPKHPESMSCPVVTIRTETPEGPFNKILRDDTMTKDADGWWTFTTYVELSPKMVGSELKALTLQFGGGDVTNSVLVVDNLSWLSHVPFPSSNPSIFPTMSQVPTGAPSSSPTRAYSVHPTGSPTPDDCRYLADFETAGAWKNMWSRSEFIPGGQRAYRRFKQWRSGIVLDNWRRECLIQDTFWSITFQTNLISNGQGYPGCDPSDENTFACPMMWLRITKPNGRVVGRFIRDTNMSWKSDGSYSTFHTYLIINEELATAKTIEWYFAGGPTSHDLYFKDLTFLKISQFPSLAPSSTPTALPSVHPSAYPSTLPSSEPSPDPCDEMIRDADLSDILSFVDLGERWKESSSTVTIVSDSLIGKNVFRIGDRWSWQGGLERKIHPLHCLIEGSHWTVSFHARLVDEKTGAGVDCTPSAASTDCPLIGVRIITSEGDRKDHYYHDRDQLWDPETGAKFVGHVTVTPNMLRGGIDSLSLLIAGGPVGTVLLLDSLSWYTTTDEPTISPTSQPTTTPSALPSSSPSATPTAEPTGEPTGTPSVMPSSSPTSLPSSSPSGDPCDDMMRVVDDDYRVYHAVSSMIEYVPNGDSYYQRATDRWTWMSGLERNVHPLHCLVPQSTWRLTFRTKLENTGDVTCDLDDDSTTNCPLIMIRGIDEMTGERYDAIIRHDTDAGHEWDDSGWNTLTMHLTVTEELKHVTSLRVIIGGGPPGSDLYVDGLSMTLTTEEPTAAPSGSPTGQPTSVPTGTPTASPSMTPTTPHPTPTPSDNPSNMPSTPHPTPTPSDSPSETPSALPTNLPSASPTTSPTVTPTDSPTDHPSGDPCLDMISDGDATGITPGPLTTVGADALWRPHSSLVSIVTVPELNNTLAFRIRDRWSWTAGLERVLYPLECLEMPGTWVITFKVKMTDEGTGNGVNCDPANLESTDCPVVWLRIVDDLGKRYDQMLRDEDMTWNSNRWNNFRTHFTVTEEMLDRGFKSIRPIFAGGPEGSVLLLDDISWTSTTAEPTGTPSSAPTANPSVAPSDNPTVTPTTSPTTPFPTETPTALPTESPTGSPTLAHSILPSSTPSISPTAVPSTTHPTPLPTDEPSSNPTAEPTTTPSSSPTSSPTTPYPTTQPTTNPTSSPTSTPTSAHSFIPSSTPSTSEPTSSPTLHHSVTPSLTPSSVPSLSPTPLPTSLPSVLPTQNPSVDPCLDMVFDGDAETISDNFRPFSSQVDYVSPGYNSQNAFKVHDRWTWNAGLERPLYPHCLVEGTGVWRITFKVRMTDEVTGAGVDCDPTVAESNDCPLVWLRIVDNNRRRQDQILRDSTMLWDSNGWNTFHTHFTVTEEMLAKGIKSIRPIFAGGPPGAVLLIDDISWKPTTAEPTAAPTGALNSSPTVTLTASPTSFP